MNAVAFSADGATLASAAYDGTVRLWGMSAGCCDVCLRFGEPVTTIAAGKDAFARRDAFVIGMGRAVCYFLATDAARKLNAS